MQIVIGILCDVTAKKVNRNSGIADKMDDRNNTLLLFERMVNQFY